MTWAGFRHVNNLQGKYVIRAGGHERCWQLLYRFHSSSGKDVFYRSSRMSGHAAQAPCPSCRTQMTYVTSIAHRVLPEMTRTTFLCAPCNQTKTYMLSTSVAQAFAGTSAPMGATG